MSRRRRRTQQAWVKWVWGISLTTMSTGCCICGRWVPAHDSLYVRKLAPGLLDEARCDQLCGEDARCFEATALVEAGTDPQLVCVGTNEYDVWTAPASGVTSPPNEKPEPLDPASPEVRCAPCTGPGRVASDCAPLEPLAASGEHLVVCFRHNAGQCVLDGPAGRHAEGVVAARGLPETPGAYFAKLAHAERVSVLTFRALARDLSRLGAPRDLIRRARRAAHDEERHYLSMKRTHVGPARASPRSAARPTSMDHFAASRSKTPSRGACARRSRRRCSFIKRGTHTTPRYVAHSPASSPTRSPTPGSPRTSTASR